MGATRRLQYQNVKIVDKYLEILESKLKEHRVFDRLEKIFQEAKETKTMSIRNIKEYEKVDRDVYRLAKHAENKYYPISHRKYAWSPVLDKAIKKVRLWTKIKKIGWYKDDAGRDRLMEELNVKQTLMTLEKIDEKLKKVEEELCEIKSRSVEFRVTFLKDLANRYAIENKVTEEVAIRELMAHEELRDLFKDIRFKMKDRDFSQTYRLWLPDDGSVTSPPPQNWKKITTPPIEITDSETMNKLILERNKNHLKQAKDTPFANTILGKKLGWDGNGVMGDEILDGQWTNNYELHEVSVEYIKGLQQKDTSVLNKVRGSITIEEYKKF